jgi:hypothetical protein
MPLLLRAEQPIFSTIAHFSIMLTPLPEDIRILTIFTHDGGS